MDFSSLPDDSAITTCRDRLNELPDSLLISILSLLKMRDVVRTTLLSKRWKDPPSSDIVDSLLLLAAEKQAEDLDIYLGPHVDGDVCANQRFYSCSSLTRLFLAYFTLKVEERVEWNQLKSLTIEHVYSFREHDMNQMLLGAPLLEELVLWSLDFEENLHIRSNSLKKLEIGREGSDCFRSVVNAELRIWAPNLLSLEISACVYGTCLLQVPNVTDLVLCFKESCNINGDVGDEYLPPLEMFYQVFRSISHVEEVILSDLGIKLLHDMYENDMAVQFSNTKFLTVYAGEPDEMLDVLEIFPQLTTLVIELDQDLWYDLEKHNYVLQSFTSEDIYPSPSLLQLKTVEIIWSQYNTSIFPAIEILLQNAHFLEKMVFRPKSYRGWCDRKLYKTIKKEGAKYEEVLTNCRGRHTVRSLPYVFLETFGLTEWKVVYAEIFP